MTNAYSLFRSVVIYGICVPLAIFLGYLLANPVDFTSFLTVSLLFGLLMAPLLLRWHHLLLVLFWNSTMGLFFLPGRPTLAMALIAASFGISMLSYIMNKRLKFISVPSVTWPLLFIVAVVLATAKLTGGIGVNALGSSQIGGRRYVVLLVSIMGYFALAARRIPLEKANTYINLYFLGGMTSVFGHLAAIVSPSFYFIFLIFPPDTAGMVSRESAAGEQFTRLSSLAMSSMALMAWLLARHNIRGLLDAKKWWRLPVFVFLLGACMLGGFRGMIITMVLTCALLFYLEGLMRSRMLPLVLITALFTCAVALPFADKLPLSIQRSITFLPLKLDPAAELSASASTDWRIEMWKEVLPTVPKYLILGKGLTIDADELEMLTSGMNRGEIGAAASELAGDYHNGPLSVVIPFGLLGLAGFVWFLGAGCRVLYRNYKFGDPALENINRYLLAFFIVKIIGFFIIFGAFASDMLSFGGAIGLSVALNGGMLGPVKQPVQRKTARPLKLTPPVGVGAVTKA